MSMTPDPYRSAYEKALADLSIISDRFEWLLATDHWPLTPYGVISQITP